MARGDYKGAIARYKQILQLKSDDWVSLVLLAQCYESDGNMSDALAVAIRAVEIEPMNFLTLKTAARLSAKSSEYNLAKAYVEQALRHMPNESLERRRLFYYLSQIIFWTLRQVARVPFLGNRINKQAVADLKPDQMVARELQEIQEWREWAHGYLEWYEKSFGVGGSETVH